MTIPQIIVALKPHKPVSRETLYGYLRRLRIKPLGIRQRPQRYPDDTARRILAACGAVPKSRNARNRRAA